MSDEIEDWKPPMPTIPNGWVAADFEDAFENVSVNGKKIKQKEYLEEGALPVVDQGAQLIGGYTNNHQSRIKIEKPVIVFGDHTRCFKYINFDFAPGADGVKVLLPQEGLDSTFLYYLCKILKLPNRGYSRHYSFLKKSVLPVAPLNEQKRIVDKIEQLFSDLDEGEALLKTVQKQLATYRQSVLKAAVTGELTKDWREKNKKNLESGEKLLARILESRRKNWNGRGKYTEPSALDVSSLPALPQGWVWSNFDQISNVITKGSSPNWQGFEYTDQGIVFVRSQNVDWGFLALDEKVFLPPAFNEKEKKSVIKSGDVLLNIVGASIGRTAVADERIDGANCNQAVAIIRLSEEISPYYACKYLLSSFAQNIIHSKKVDVARANFNLNQIAELAVALPGRDEQEEIIQRIDKVFSQIDTFEALCEAELKRSTTLRQAILKSAFSGKLVAQDPADEPASELLARIKSGDSPKAKTKTAAPRRGRKLRSDKSEAAQIEHKQKKVRRE